MTTPSEATVEHELDDVDMSHYTDEMWFNELFEYLTLVGANEKQALSEIKNRFGLTPNHGQLELI